MDTKVVLGKYTNGNYEVTIYDDGTKVRENDLDNLIPSFSESCDVKITDKCSQGCKYCYEGCTKEGKHANLLGQAWVDSLHPYTELALNGNDLDHPQLQEFLEKLKEKKVIANITVNQNQYISNYDKINSWVDTKLIYGLGISYLDPSILNYVKGKSNIVLHLINGVVGKNDFLALRNKDLKILILGYKERGRGLKFLETNKEEVDENKKWLYTHLRNIIPLFKCVSFDNLSLNQLEVKRIVKPEQWNEFYMGDDGQYTFYIDAVSEMFSKDSVTFEKEHYDISGKTIDEMFNFIQNKYGKEC